MVNIFSHDLNALKWLSISYQTRKTATPKSTVPLHSVPVGYPMQRIALDILGPLPITASGNKYILVVSDYFSKWTEAYAMSNQEAETVARRLVDRWCNLQDAEYP